MWFSANRWQVSPHNALDDVIGGFEIPETCFVLDSTIRNMSAIPGSSYSLDGVVELARIAGDIGVQVVEIDLVHGNMPSTPRLLDMFEAIARISPKFKLYGTARPYKSSIDDIAARGGVGVNLGSRGVGERGGEFGTWLEAAQYATERGLEVAANLEGRIEHMAPQRAAGLINSCLPASPTYIGIHENNNCNTPETWRWYVQSIRRRISNDVALVPHIHDTLGLGSASAVAAVTGGCRGIDLAMNGVGIHGGHAALETVVLALETLYGIKTGLKLDSLTDYSRAVERVSGVAINPYHAIVGPNVHLCELEPFVEQVLLNREQRLERVHPYAPSLVGAKNDVVWGANTLFGESVKVKLRQMGLPHDGAATEKVLSAMRRALAAKTAYPIWLTEREVEQIAKESLSA